MHGGAHVVIDEQLEGLPIPARLQETALSRQLQTAHQVVASAGLIAIRRLARASARTTAIAKRQAQLPREIGAQDIGEISAVRRKPRVGVFVLAAVVEEQ